MEITPRRGPGASLRGLACSPRRLRLLQVRTRRLPIVFVFY